MPKPKKPIRTKEQLLKEQAQEQEAIRRRKLVKEELYPLLCEVTDNIDDAKRLCGATASAAQSMFLNRMRNLNIEELGLHEMVDKTNKDSLKFLKLIELIQKENVAVAMELLNGFAQEIDAVIHEENKGKSLKDLDMKLL